MRRSPAEPIPAFDGRALGGIGDRARHDLFAKIDLERS
jgi:hypothetical protein